ncbi:MAG: LysR family transcriptional regulator [Myxococcota bacterium]
MTMKGPGEASDYLDIDGRQLRILLTIHEVGSLTAAAKVLDMNQSTVSYWLEALRRRLDDPLFVRAGQGVEPTERATALVPAAREALRQLEALCEPDVYDPSSDRGTLRISTNAVVRDLIMAPLLRLAMAEAPHLNFEIQSRGSNFEIFEHLQQGSLDLALAPASTDLNAGIMARLALKFEDAVYFDPQYPLAAGDLDAFCARPQARVVFGAEAGFRLDRKLAELGRTRRVALQVGDFDTALTLIVGTPMIATLPSVLAETYGHDLSLIEPPWPQPPRKIMMYWHERHQTSARSLFWRRRIADLGGGRLRRPGCKGGR